MADPLPPVSEAGATGSEGLVTDGLADARSPGSEVLGKGVKGADEKGVKGADEGLRPKVEGRLSDAPLPGSESRGRFGAWALGHKLRWGVGRLALRVWLGNQKHVSGHRIVVQSPASWGTKRYTGNPIRSLLSSAPAVVRKLRTI